eukprot:9397146-Pyramimonas_sp.AAC.1
MAPRGRRGPGEGRARRWRAEAPRGRQGRRRGPAARRRDQRHTRSGRLRGVRPRRVYLRTSEGGPPLG